MLFNSLPFLFLFLPVALAGYYLGGRLHPMFSAAWLCLASLVFYAWWNPAFVALLALSIVFNYLVSLAILSTQEKARLHAWVLGLGIAANIAVLFHYKYFATLVGYLNHFGFVDQRPDDIILPLGISFFTFTQIGFLLDCAAGVARERGFLSYVLFVTFFPHLIAGPILHHKEMMPQFAHPENYRFKAENLSVGGTLFVIGLAKKVLLADSIAPWAEAGFSQPGQLQLLGAWGVALTYALQLYFDFSGYSDMAIGLAKMFGIRFPLNFNSPYKSTGIIEFWTRFHMTLTRYLTAYLYNPVALAVTRSRARKGYPVGRKATATLSGFSSMVVFPSIFTMGLAGVWHGAGWQFLIFGLLHGVYLAVNHAWRQFGPGKGKKGPSRGWRRACYILLTFVCAVVALLFFRANSTSDALRVLAGMLGMHGVEPMAPVLFPLTSLWDGNAWSTGEWLRLTLERWAQGGAIVVLLAVVWLAPNSNQIMGAWSSALEGPDPAPRAWMRWRPNVTWAVLVFAVLFYAMLHMHKTVRFLYFQF